MESTELYDILEDDLGRLTGQGAAFVTLGEVMIRDTPADEERLERTRQVWLSLAGSEFTLAIMLCRLGVPSAYVTRLPDNPYGWMVRNTAREQGVSTDHIVWADRAEPIGRFLYELGRTPRAGAGWYQRKHSRNYLSEAFQEALAAKPDTCQVGLDFNYRKTLWSPEQCRQVMTPLVTDHVDVLITTIEDMAKLYRMDCGTARADDIYRGNLGRMEDDDLQSFMRQLIERFDLQVAGLTIRYPDSHEQHRWESAAMDREGHFARSSYVHSIVLRAWSWAMRPPA